MRSRKSIDEHAFTLIEILIVIVIIAISAALLLPNISSVTDRGAEDRALRIVGGAVQRAQDLALLRHEPQVITFDLDKNTVTVSGEPRPIAWPERAKLQLVRSGSSALIRSGPVEIPVDRFGNLIPFEVKIGRTIHVAANPFTGLLESVK